MQVRVGVRPRPLALKEHPHVRVPSLDEEALRAHCRDLVRTEEAQCQPLLDLVEHLSAQLFAADYGAETAPDRLVIFRAGTAGRPPADGTVRIHAETAGGLRVVYTEPGSGREHERACSPAELERVVRARLIRLRLETQAAV